jgi:hypothetical protein
MLFCYHPCYAIIDPFDAIVESYYAIIKPCYADPSYAIIGPSYAIIDAFNIIIDQCYEIISPCMLLSIRVLMPQSIRGRYTLYNAVTQTFQKGNLNTYRIIKL